MESLNKELSEKLEQSKDDTAKTLSELHKRLHETVSVEFFLVL